MSDGLRKACDQFEQVMLAQLLPRSLFGSSVTSADGVTPTETSANRDLFAQAFAMAFERAGGFGLSRELQADLGKRG